MTTHLSHYFCPVILLYNTSEGRKWYSRICEQQQQHISFWAILVASIIKKFFLSNWKYFGRLGWGIFTIGGQKVWLAILSLDEIKTTRFVVLNLYVPSFCCLRTWMLLDIHNWNNCVGGPGQLLHTYFFTSRSVKPTAASHMQLSGSLFAHIFFTLSLPLCLNCTSFLMVSRMPWIESIPGDFGGILVLESQ